MWKASGLLRGSKGQQLEGTRLAALYQAEERWMDPGVEGQSYYIAEKCGNKALNQNDGSENGKNPV